MNGTTEKVLRWELARVQESIAERMKELDRAQERVEQITADLERGRIEEADLLESLKGIKAFPVFGKP